MMMFNAVEMLTTQDELSALMRYFNRARSAELQSVFFSLLCQNQKTARLARGNATIRDWIVENHVLMT
jgi:hypothetical protein